jgi:putative addiction module component (TIGR02574 family)
MARDAGEILRDALALPPEARAALADSLWESLEGQADEAAEGAWRKEIERRVRDLDSGTVTSIPWTEVRKRLLSKLSE